MRFRWFLLLMTVALAFVTQSPVFAQSGAAGSLVGTVTDQQGNPLKGVTIKAESPDQIGVKTASTDADGYFTILGATPGTYKVTASSPGMAPIVQEGVAVGINAPAELNFFLEKEGAEETLTIVDKPSRVSTSDAAVRETYSLKLVESVPFSEPINQFRDIIDMTPGTLNRRVRGAGQRGTLFLQDGFEIKEQFPSLRSSQAFETTTAAYFPLAPTATGGVQTLVTRSGSNDFRFEFTSLYDSTRLRLFAEPGEQLLDRDRIVINPTFSGPIVKDKLWYHLNIETHFVREPQEPDPFGRLPESQSFRDLIPKVTFKTRWQMTSRDKLELLANGDWPYQRNNRRAPGIADSAQADRQAQRYFAGLTYERVLTDTLLFRTQLGYGQFLENIYPSSCRGDVAGCYDTPNVRQTIPGTLEDGNGPKHDINNLQAVQFNNSLDWFLATSSFGTHKIRLSHRFWTEQSVRKTSQTGDRQIELAGNVNLRQTEFYANDPRLEPAEFGFFSSTVYQTRQVALLSDAWSITKHFTVTPAIAFAQSKATNDKDVYPIEIQTFLPSLQTVWDVSKDGSTVLRASGSVYADMELERIGRHPLGTQVQQRCNWNAATQAYDQDCQFSGGASNTVAKDLTTPKTYELTLGGQTETSPGTTFGLDAIYRRFTNPFEDFETNRIWNESGTAILGYRNGRNETISELRTPDDAYREYYGLTASLSKQEGDLLVNASYTLGFLYGNVLDGFNNFYGTIPSMDRFLDGPLDDDHRHEIKLTGTYQWTPWLSTGVRYLYISGTPGQRLFYNAASGTYQTYRAGSGIDPGQNLNDPEDDRAIRLPDRQQFNLQIRAMLEPFLKQNVSVFFEVVNVLGLRTTLTQGSADGRDYGVPLTRTDPLKFRIGLDFRWPGTPAPPPRAPAPPPQAAPQPAPPPAPAPAPAAAPEAEPPVEEPDMGGTDAAPAP